MTQVSPGAIQSLPLAAGMDARHLEILSRIARETSFDADQVVFTEGATHDWFYMILSGKVALELKTPTRVFRVHTLGEGDALGWSAMLAGEKRHFQARALQPVKALEFDGDALQQACQDDPTFGVALLSRLLRVVSDRLEATRLRLLEVYARQE